MVDVLSKIVLQRRHYVVNRNVLVPVLRHVVQKRRNLVQVHVLAQGVLKGGRYLVHWDVIVKRVVQVRLNGFQLIVVVLVVVPQGVVQKSLKC